MELKYICTYWGSTHIPIDDFIEKAMGAGYDGIELNIPFDTAFTDSLKKSIEKFDALCIAQQWLPPANESVETYRQRMKLYLRHLASVNPVFINSHTGKDFFSFNDNCSLIEDCMALSKETGIKIIHETHRGRFAHHAFSTLKYLEKYNTLNLNADFSHFCNVSESLLEDQDDIVKQIIPRCHYIHARVGSDQSAQVNHPFAPECKSNLTRFVTWWQNILDEAKKRGELTFYICPEFGPAPYMPSLPFTQQPVSNQWDINMQMMDYLKKILKNSS